MTDSPYDPLYRSAGAGSNLDPLFLRAMAIVESQETPNAVSPKGAGGIIQFMPQTAKTAGPNGTPINPYVPEQAIPAAARTMDGLIEKNSDVNTALMEWHGGPDRSIWGPKTMAFPVKVAAVYQDLKKQPAATSGAGAGAGTGDDAPDYFEQALKKNVPSVTVHTPDGSPGDDAPDYFGMALGGNNQGSQQFGAEPPGSEKAGNWGIPSPHDPVTPPENGVSLSDVGPRLGAALQRGFMNTPNLLGPETQRLADKYLPSLGGAATVGSAFLGGVNALYEAAKEGVSMSGEAIGEPRLGRDLATMMDVVPLMTGGVPRMAPVEGPKATFGLSKLQKESMTAETEALSQPTHVNNQQYYPEAVSPGEARPGAVGAMSSTAKEAAMSEREAMAHRAVTENNLLNETATERANADGVDTTPYVEGSNPTKAEWSGNPGISIQQRADMANPEVADQYVHRLEANDTARKAHFDAQAGSQVTLQRLKDARAEQAQRDIASQSGAPPMAPEQPQSFVDWIDETLKKGGSKSDAIADALGNVRKKMFDGDKLETDPGLLTEVYGEINRMLGKNYQRGNPTSIDAAGALRTAKAKLADVIEQGSPGYKTFLANYADASKAIDAQELLQGYRPDLVDSKGVMQLTRVQKMMKDIVEDRDRAGANPAKSLTNDQMSALWNLRNDLARAGRLDAAKARGSTTTQEMRASGLLGNLGRYAGLGLAHSAVGAVSPVVGNFLLKTAMDARVARKAAEAEAATKAALHSRTDEYLRPPKPPPMQQQP